jgi:disulfide bond formation protein DsbB
MVAELGVLVLGVVIYVVLRSQRHPVRATRLAVLLLILLGTYFGTQFEPLPPSTMVVAITEKIGQAKLKFDMVFMLAIDLAAWADRRATPDELAAPRVLPEMS